MALDAATLAFGMGQMGARNSTPTTVNGSTASFGFDSSLLENLNLEGILDFFQNILSSLGLNFDLKQSFAQAAGGAAGNDATAEATAEANAQAAKLNQKFQAQAQGTKVASADPSATGGTMTDAALDKVLPTATEFSLNEQDSIGMYKAMVDDNQTSFTTSDGKRFEVIHTSSTDSGFDAVAAAGPNGEMVYMFEGMAMPDNAAEVIAKAGDNPDMMTLMEEGTGQEFSEDKGALISHFEGAVTKYGVTIHLNSSFSAQRADFMKFMEASANAAETKFGELPTHSFTVGHSWGTRFQAEAAVSFGMKGVAMAPAGISSVLLNGNYPGAEAMTPEEREKLINSHLFVVADATDIASNAIGKSMDVDRNVDVAGQAQKIDGQFNQFGGHGTPDALLRGIKAPGVS